MRHSGGPAARVASGVVLLLAWLAASAAAQQPEAAIDSIFARFDRLGSPGCAVAITRAGRTVFRKGYGYANLDWDIPITPSTVFYAGSVSKQFTASSIV
ncbi:MAG: serine hydrolase, partial [Gemmatimonadota bacterium]